MTWTDARPSLTRSDWEAEADRWLTTARGHAEAGGALICPPGPPSQSGRLSDGIEGFARSFLIAAARLAGSADADPLGHAEWYADGLAEAMSPKSPGHWPRAVAASGYPHDGLTQPTVEAANLAFGLALCREQVWDRLDEGVRERLADWLAHHARLRVWESNWLLFPAIVEAFLTSVGVDVPGGHGAESVERVESWYLGDGWYNDGPLVDAEGTAAHGRNIDHYNSWVIHPFLWQWYRLRGDAEPAWRVERFRARLTEFAASHALLFAPDGSPLYQGRSLTYRHAVLGGLWTAALADADPLPPGAVRELAGLTLRHFARLGVDGRAAPSLGWGASRFLPAVQPYSGPGSPYFAGMGFLGLAAPADHPVWAAEPAPVVPQRATVTALPALGWLVQHGRADGIVRVVNHGSDHATAETDLGDPHYAKFAYSTHTAPGTGPAWADRAWPGGVDGHVALVDEWGRATRRGRIMGNRVGDGFAASWHLPRLEPSGRPLPGAHIVTASLTDATVEARCHLVTAPVGWRVREGGDAVAAAASPPTSGVGESPTGPYAWAAGDGGIRSRVVGLQGYEPGTGAVSQHRDANAFGTYSAAPFLLGTAVPEAEGDGPTVHVALHLLDRTDQEASSTPTVTVTGTCVTVQWPDGRRAAVDLAALF